MNVRLFAFVPLAVLLISGSLRAETAEQWIAKARAYLGPENALNAVTTVHFTGTLEVTTPAANEKAVSAEVTQKLPAEIIFQKPYQQAMTVTRPATVDTMVLDDYDGWSRISERADPKQWKLSLLDAEQIKQLRANTWENLNFYAGLEKRGGAVEVGEEVSVDGVPCIKLSFVHSDRIVFRRYFDKSTGRLVKTETANGSEIHEEGEIVSGGIRFPKKITNKAPTGQVTTIVFETVVLNEPIPPATFAVPSLSPE